MGPSQIHKVSETLKMVDWDEIFRYDNVSKCYDWRSTGVVRL